MWETVDLREIRVFLALAEELHFGRTADRLALTQSRVSQTLRTLETKLGDQLLTRTSRHVALTAAGERLLSEVERPYRELRDALERCSGADRPLHGALRLGVTAAGALAPGLLGVVDAFEARYPDCRVEVVELPFDERYEPLRRGAVDLMVARLPLKDRAIVIGPVISTEPRVVAVARDHPLARRDTVAFEDLADYPHLDLTSLVPKEVADSYLPVTTPSGRRIPRIPDAVADFSELVIMIARGRIVQLTVASAATRFAHPSVICVPLADMPPSSTALAWRRRASNPPLVAFLELANSILSNPPPNWPG